MATTKLHRVCFLAYARQYELARAVIQELNEPDVEFILMECGLENQDECVQDAISAGCEVFVSGPGNTARFLNHYHYPIVEIPIQYIDYALAIRYALRKGCKKIAVAWHRFSAPLDTKLLHRLMDTELSVLEFESSEELLALARSSDCDALIGTSLAVEVAEETGKLGVLLYLGTEGMRLACLKAAALAREQYTARHNREITKAIMNNAQLSIIVTDRSGAVLFINHLAQEYTGLTSAQLHGKQLAEFFPNLSVQPLIKSTQKQSDSYRMVEGVMMRCVQERILLKRETIGVLITLHPDSHNRRGRGKQERINAHIYHWNELTAYSDAMQRLVEQGRNLSALSYPTVIIGEPGSGREEIAYCIHGGSDRAQAPCLTIDLATFSEMDAPRVLFGYDKGDSSVIGLFASANGGSVVLKNIALAKPNVLACIQQAVTDRELIHPGLLESSPHVVIYTMLDQAEYEMLPPDLKSALSVCKLQMPPLRQRKEDIAKLFSKYVNQISNLPVQITVTDEMEQLLQSYRWPGNVRELRTVSTRYVIARSALEHLTPRTQYLLLLQSIGEEEVFRDLCYRYPVLLQRPVENVPAFLEALNVLKKTMKYSNDIAAKRLDLSRTTLWRILKEAE